jgi:F0F1-type ATP synthase assembly protein I
MKTKGPKEIKTVMPIAYTWVAVILVGLTLGIFIGSLCCTKPKEIEVEVQGQTYNAV